MEKYNTLALAYTNEQGDVVAWSSDTFGTSDKYPKTYKDTESNREMLLKKFKTKDEFSKKTVNFLSENNSLAGALMSASVESDKKFFDENKVTGAVLVALDLYTEYSRDVYLPKWKDVVHCVDNKEYKKL